MSPYTYPPTNVHVCPAQSTASRGTREARSDPAEDMQGATGQTGRVRRGDVCHPMGEGRGGEGITWLEAGLLHGGLGGRYGDAGVLQVGLSDAALALAAGRPVGA